MSTKKEEHESNTCYEDCEKGYDENGDKKDFICDDCSRREIREHFISRADKVEQRLRSIPGIRVSYREAQTGSVYMTVHHESLDQPLKIRVSDHADAYATSDYSADGYDGSDDGAVSFVLKKISGE